MARWLSILLAAGVAMAAVANEPAKLDNPMSVSYLQQHLAKGHPRLVFSPSILEGLKSKLESDPVLQSRYAAIRLNADGIFDQPLLKRKMVGRRLLGTSREMLYRINMLGVVYLVEKDAAALRRIDEELLAVCAFSDWNPSHFLDVAEMSMAVALALDWTVGALPDSTVALAKSALIEKGLNPSWPADGKRWSRAYGNNNWNQVCNGGLIAAAIAVADDEPELAAKTIARALDGMPNVLVEYAPDGVYPEGSTYWEYGTGFSVVTAAMFESAFGRDFGLYEFPGFKESARFRALCNAPSGWYFNFADCGDRRSRSGDGVLAWFAAKSGNKTFFEQERFLRPAKEQGKLSRLDGAAMAWLSQYEEKGGERVPTAWKGEGSNPIVVFRGADNDPHAYYFGGKGGRATTSHGNMDAGSFVLELDGVRWAVDPGNQSYNALEKTGFDLWNRKQNSDRWTLLTKNNFGHSTLTVNNEPFVVDGFAPLVDFEEGARPEAAFDLTAVYGGNVARAVRRFTKTGPASLLIEDRIECSEKTKRIVWQLVTTADCEAVDGGAVLRQDGKELQLRCVSHPELTVSVVPLCPPPLELDRRIEGLKRLEVDVPVHQAVDGTIVLRIALSTGEKEYD
ncbi:heparinase II/III family protein [Pontiella sp.]|uniref:heparinase II/III domain-containing protein n=1 Tax=Pontiella sp. TaxID=2837462 RepID=UPI0035660DEC